MWVRVAAYFRSPRAVLGAYVHSFDYDLDSVKCTEDLRGQYRIDPTMWQVEPGSVLDELYLGFLGRFDYVYCWGVLHHTGRMWHALERLVPLVEQGGKLFLGVYNDQAWISRYWTRVKGAYNRDPFSRTLVMLAHAPYLFFGRLVIRALTGRLDLERGMPLWHDMRDWLGGYPFEVATPQAVFDFMRAPGLVLTKLQTCSGRHGCNEYVFRRSR